MSALWIAMAAYAIGGFAQAFVIFMHNWQASVPFGRLIVEAAVGAATWPINLIDYLF